MAEKNLYVHQNFNEQQVLNAVLERVGVQTVADAAALATLTTTLQTLPVPETKRVMVFRTDNLTFYVWDGGGATGVFQTSGSPTGAMVFRGGLDGSSTVVSTTTVTDGTNTYGNIKTGNTFIFTVAGTLPAAFGSAVVEIGDTLIFRGTTAGEYADNTELTTAANWTIVQNNVGAASNTTLGLVRTATSTEVRDGTTGAPTPSVIKSDSISARQHAPVAFNLVANTGFVITHNLNTKNVSVVIRDSADQEIGVLVEHTSVNTVTITSNVALTGVLAFITSW